MQYPASYMFFLLLLLPQVFAYSIKTYGPMLSASRGGYSASYILFPPSFGSQVLCILNQNIWIKLIIAMDVK
jgi:hypothetical protein